MKSTILGTLLLSVLGILTATASPVELPQSNELINATRDPDFPPGPQPPGPILLYEVKYHVPRVKILFHSWNLSNRDETQAEDAIRKAVVKASNPAIRDQRITLAETWASGQVSVWILPQDILPPGREPGAIGPLTWNTWSVALIGITKWRLAYPGLDTNYLVYVERGPQGRELAGLGGFFTSPPDSYRKANATDGIGVFA